MSFSEGDAKVRRIITLMYSGETKIRTVCMYINQG